MNRRLIAVALPATVVLMTTTGACSIDPEGSPREIAARDQRELIVTPQQPAGAATGTGRIYLLSPEVLGQPRTLQPVRRDLGGTASDAIRALFEGPNSTELQATLRTAIPPGTQLLGVIQSGPELVVDVSSEFQQLTGEALIDGVAQIVLTAVALPGVFSVAITVDGTRQQWPSGSGELQSDPLTRYDFPGLVLSSQPAFPPVPSPTQPD
jgi:spore germination protein GerM